MSQLMIIILVGAGIILIIAVAAAIASPKEPLPEGTLKLKLPLKLETFIPIPLPQGRRYRIQLTGTYRYRRWWTWYKADARYYAWGQNFDQPYRNLFFDGEPAPAPSHSDCHLHTYSFVYVATGRKLSVRLNPPEKDGSRTQGMLNLVITPLSVEEQEALDQEQAALEAEEQQHKRRQARQEAKERREKAEQLQPRQEALEQADRKLEADGAALIAAAEQHAQAERRRQEEEARIRQEESQAQTEPEPEELPQDKEAQRRATLQQLRLRAQRENYYLDTEYRENLAKNKTKEVLDAKDAVAQEYDQVMGDEELLSFLQLEGPDVLEWLEKRVEVVRLAERVAVASPPAPATEAKKGDRGGHPSQQNLHRQTRGQR